MLKIENTEVMGWEHAIRGMRNPKNSLLDLANYSIMTVLEIDDAQHEQEIAEQKTCDEGASNAD